MIILAIDPGTTESGMVYWDTDDGSISAAQIRDNDHILKCIYASRVGVVAIEWIQSYGMAVGKTTFETCLWAGRFVEAAKGLGFPVRMIPRGPIKLHHCQSSRAKDSNISQALRDKYGEKGTKKEPGFFFGVKSHIWQACAVAAYVAEGGESEHELKF